jgi:cysteine synthase A
MITDFSNLVGNTPLIRLNKLSQLSGCEILGKAEFLNPGSSVKDRAALSIINEAILSGDLKPGGTIVEGTAGNTGIGLTLIGASMGFSTVIVIPETQTKEKKDALKNSGARLIEVPAVPYSNANNYIKYSKRLAFELNTKLPKGAFWANQFDNLANRRAHIATTAPEIYQQSSGKVDAFICSVGTGGTLSGVSEGLRALKPHIKIGLVDPFGSALHKYFTEGELLSEGSSISEGIGQGRITENLRDLSVDVSFRVSDHAALNLIYDLLYEEGLSVGISAGINMAGALEMAKTLKKGSTVVTILCDHGMRYQSKIFNHDFLTDMGLPVPFWMNGSTMIMPDVSL